MMPRPAPLLLPPRDRLAQPWEAALLVLAVAHVLCYALLAPPWYHYDEPTSLEYALLLRDLGRLPAYEEISASTQVLIAASMRERPLFAEVPLPLAHGGTAVSLGFNQRVHPPTYYMLIALLLVPARGAPIETQLAIARLGSVALAALCFYLALRALRLLVADPEARLCTAAALALLPPFADIMSAVNSDVLANTLAVAMLWVALAFLRRPSRATGRLTLLAAASALLVKRVLLAPAVIMLATLALMRIAHRPRLRAAVVGALVCALGGAAGLALLLPQRLADWSPVPPEAAVTSPVGSPAFGRRAFLLERPAAGAGPMVAQELDPQLVQAARGRILTLTGRVRASHPGMIARSPTLQIDQQVTFDHVLAGPAWATVSTSSYVPVTARSIIVRLHGPYTLGAIWYDEIALVIAEAPSSALPDGSFELDLLPPTTARNLVRNPGAERMLPDFMAVAPASIRPLIARRTVDSMLSRLFDPAWQLAAYPRQLGELFRGFWGVFSWGEIVVNSGWLLSLGLIVLAGVAGAARLSGGLLIGRSSLPLITADAWWLSLGLVLGTWVIAVARVALQPVPGLLIWSFGRYTYPAVLPALALLMVGCAAILPLPLRRQGLVGVTVFLAVYALAVLLGTLLPAWAAA
jgi:hypothetical protein